MKKLILMFLVSTIVYVCSTAITTVLINPMVFIDESLKWQAKLWMFGNMMYTMIITWWGFKGSFPKMMLSGIVTIIVVNAFKIISQAIDGDISPAHILLLFITVTMLFSMYKVANRGVTI